MSGQVNVDQRDVGRPDRQQADRVLGIVKGMFNFVPAAHSKQPLNAGAVAWIVFDDRDCGHSTPVIRGKGTEKATVVPDSG